MILVWTSQCSERTGILLFELGKPGVKSSKIALRILSSANMMKRDDEGHGERRERKRKRRGVKWMQPRVDQKQQQEKSSPQSRYLMRRLTYFAIQKKLNYHCCDIMIPVGNLFCQPTYLLNWQDLFRLLSSTRNLPNNNIGSSLFCDRKPYVLWQNGC